MPHSIRLPDWFIQSVSQYALDEPQMQYLMQGKPLYLTTDLIRHPSRSGFERAGITAGAIAPITYQERIIGTLNLGSYTHKTILLSARRAIEAIALQIGGSVARRRPNRQDKSAGKTCNPCSIRCKTCVSSSTRQGGSCMPIARSANDRDIQMKNF